MIVLGKRLRVRMELPIILGCYFFCLLILVFFGPKTPVTPPATAPGGIAHWSASRQPNGEYDLRDYGRQVDEWLIAAFADAGFLVIESSWTMEKTAGKEGRFLWLETEYRVALETDDPLQTIGDFYHKMKGQKDVDGLETLFADGVILDDILYYRLDLGITTPGKGLATHRIFVQLPRLGSAKTLEKWAVARSKPDIKPLQITPPKKQPVVQKKKASKLVPVVKPHLKPARSAVKKRPTPKPKPVVKPWLKVKEQPKRAVLKLKEPPKWLPLIKFEYKPRPKTAVKPPKPKPIVKPRPKPVKKPALKLREPPKWLPLIKFEYKPRPKPAVEKPESKRLALLFKSWLKSRKKPVVKKKEASRTLPVVATPHVEPQKPPDVVQENSFVPKGLTTEVKPELKPPAVKPTDRPIVIPPPPRKPAEPIPAEPRKPRSVARVAIIIDDFGFVEEPADAFFSIPEPLTIAVMPGGEYSTANALRADESGFEVLLHQPLEPVDMDRNNPGPGLIHSGQSDQEILSVFRSNLADVPGAVGFNNHMGSKGSRDPRIMELLLKEAKRKGLFFVDSRSIARTVGEPIANRLGVPHAARTLFLDNELAQLRQQLDSLIKIAQRDGQAIGIAHARPGRAAVIRDYLPKFRAAGVEIVPVSALLQW